MAAERYTRCPHCASVFRVLPGQLQQAQGWLRCGQCQQAFDATGHVVVWGAADEAIAPREGERLDLESLLRVQDKGAAEPAAPAFSDELLAFEQALASFPVPTTSAPPVPAATLPAAEPAERASRRVAPGWVACLLALLLLQSVWATRAQWAVQWPVWGRWAQAACDHLGCAWWPWHEPRLLNLEHAHLSRAGADQQLQWVMRNQATWPAAMPSLELTLLDAREQVLLRRVLSPADQQAPAVLAPLAHWSGDLRWRVPDELPVAGYRLLAFYPVSHPKP